MFPAVVIATILLLTAACSSERADVPAGVTTPVATASADVSSDAASGASPGASASAPAGARGPDAPAGGNAKEVCAAVMQTSSESATAFVRELVKSLEAASKGDTTGAEAARKRADTVLDNWAAALREQATKATDERLKAALNEVAAEVSRMNGSVESVDENRLDELQQRVERLCAA
jgi:hypothetical protein